MPMLYNTVSTLGMSRRLQTSLGELQVEMMRRNDELASGKHFDVAEQLGARTGQAISLRNLHSETDEYLKTASLLDGRLTTMDSAMASILKSGNDLLASAATGLGQPSPTGSALQNGARGVLDQIVGLLNASSGDGYLFGGVEVKQPPMRHAAGDGSALRAPIDIVRDAMAAAAGGTPAPDSPAETAAIVAVLADLFAVRDPGTPAPAPLTDTFEGGFYLGATAMKPGGAANPRLTARADGAAEIPYGVQANDPMFRDLLQGLYMLATIDTSALPLDAYQPYMQAAVDKLGAGLNGLRDATAQLGIQRARLDEIQEQHKARLTILAGQINALEEVDPAEASVRLNQLEVQIEMTSNATARISRLSLANYL